MLRQVGCEDDIDRQVAESFKVFRREVGQEVVVRTKQVREPGRGVVILEHAAVVVKQRQRVLCLDQEDVCQGGVVVVVNHGTDKHAQDVKGRRKLLDALA